MRVRQKTTRLEAFGSIMIDGMSSSSFSPFESRVRLGLLACCAVGALVVACSSSSDNTSSGGTLTATSTAAAVAGPADTHCAGKPVVVVSQAACHVEEDAGHDHDHDGGEEDAGAEPAGSDYGDTLYGSEGEDDDCKYHVKWQSTPVTNGADVTFAIVATNRSDNSPVAGATPFAEIFLNETHPAPNTPVKTTETSPGNYTIGPVKFDATGNWNVRFHFHDECTDSEESPHGHVAFFVKVP